MSRRKHQQEFAGCDFREYRYDRMESALKVIRTWMSAMIDDGIIAAGSGDILDLVDRALGVKK
jgi:hypothetical protein